MTDNEPCSVVGKYSEELFNAGGGTCEKQSDAEQFAADTGASETRGGHQHHVSGRGATAAADHRQHPGRAAMPPQHRLNDPLSVSYRPD